MSSDAAPIRVVLAKVGLDGHDRGIKVVARALRDAGMQVIYAGLWQTPEAVVRTVGDHGNTSAASIPLAISVAVQDGRVKKGDLVLLEAMGGGFTWGSVLLRW